MGYIVYLEVRNESDIVKFKFPINPLPTKSTEKKKTTEEKKTTEKNTNS